MEEQNKNTEEQLETEVSQANEKQEPSNRSNILMLLAGLYLLYTGYKLCKNVLDGVDGGGWGFFAAGVGFLIVGAGMLFVSGKNYLKQDKEKRAAEAAEAEKVSQEEPQAEKKPMSIAERARLAEKLKETDEAEASEE